MRHALVRLASRIRLALLRGRVDEEARGEIDQHLELLVARYVRSGMTPDQARMAALLVVVAGGAMYAPARKVFRVSPARLLSGQ